MSDLEEIIRSLLILDITLRASDISVRGGVELQGYDIYDNNCLIQTFRKPVDIVEGELEPLQDGVVTYRYNFTHAFGIRVIHPDELEDSKAENFVPLLEIKATFLARYGSKSKLLAEGLDAFAKRNVPFNIWPFWREYAQSSCSRIGLNPGLIIPLFRVPKSDEDGENDEASGDTASK